MTTINVSDLWKCLTEICCPDPPSAKRIVMLSKEQLIRACFQYSTLNTGAPVVTTTTDLTEQEIVERTERYKKRVERRAKFFATLTKHQRIVRDSHVAWVRRWRIEYFKLVNEISKNKQFIRKQGHNNLAALKLAMRRLEEQKFRARGMILARMASKADYAMKLEREPGPKREPKIADKVPIVESDAAA